SRVRRLRSVLGVYHRAFDRAAATELRTRLRGLGQQLGEARDLEVREAELQNLVPTGSAPEVVDVVNALALDARREYDAAERALLGRLRGRANRVLLADLQVFAADPPLRKRALKHPDELIAKALERARQRVEVLSEGIDGAESTLEQRHELRKAARRLRFAAETVTEPDGSASGDIGGLAADAEAVQHALGRNRDLVLLVAHLRGRFGAVGLSPSATAGVARLADQRESDAARTLDPLTSHLERLRSARLP
ncbi:MAG TPA: CHAD domain-containing protein, partial [Leifsonia sp.]|nr:CHAD domain-containing protein [Leifsonia sp.]